MAKQNKTQNKTQYEILVWSGGRNYFTQQEDGELYWFEITEAAAAQEQWSENIADGYLGSYVTIKKYNRDGDQVAEFGVDMRDCQPVSELPKYVQKHVAELMEATQHNDELLEWEELNS